MKHNPMSQVEQMIVNDPALSQHVGLLLQENKYIQSILESGHASSDDIEEMMEKQQQHLTEFYNKVREQAQKAGIGTPQGYTLGDIEVKNRIPSGGSGMYDFETMGMLIDMDHTFQHGFQNLNKPKPSEYAPGSLEYAMEQQGLTIVKPPTEPKPSEYEPGSLEYAMEQQGLTIVKPPTESKPPSNFAPGSFEQMLVDQGFTIVEPPSGPVKPPLDHLSDNPDITKLQQMLEDSMNDPNATMTIKSSGGPKL